MNTPKAYLWQLIHSLTPAEKRYFKTHFAIRDNQQTALYELVNAQEVYDESACRSQLEVSSSQFKVLKHQLQELLMKSLVANHAKRSVKSKIRLELEEVDLLLERELFAEAIKRLQKLEQLCVKYGFTLYQYEVLERLHEIQHLELDFSDPAASLHYDRLVVLQKTLQQKQALSAIQLKLDDWNPFTPERSKVLQELYDSLTAMPAEYLDFSGNLAWLQTLAICSDLLGREEEATRYRVFMLDNFEQLPKLRAELPLSYLRALQHTVNSARKIPKLVDVEGVARKARKVIAQHPQYSPHYIYFLWASLRASFLHHRWEYIAQNLEQDCLAHLEAYRLGEFRTAVKMYILLGITHIVLKNFSLAQHYLETYRSNKLSKDRWLDYSVNLLELMLYYEAREIEKLASRLVYFRRQLRADEQAENSPLYALHLHLFADILREPFHKQELGMSLLLQIADYPYDPLLYYYSFFNIERWLQAVAAKRAWEETIRAVGVRMN